MKKLCPIFFALSTCSMLALFSPLANAATSTWKSSSAAWTSGTSWSTGAVPDSTTTAIINNSGTITLGSGISGTAATLITGSSAKGNVVINGGLLTTGTAMLGNTSNGSGTIAVSSGTWLNSGNITVGGTGTGVLTVSGNGEVTLNSGAGTLTLALGNKSNGTLNYNGGTLNAAVVDIGKGAGTININANSFSPAIIASGTGVMTVNYLGTGTLSLTGTQSFNGYAVVDNGAVQMTGATVNQGSKSYEMHIADQSSSTGAVIFTGSTTASLSAIYVGMAGAGSVTVSNATVNTPTTTIGYFSTASGTFTMSSGTWNNTTGDGTGTLDLGQGGAGVMNITGGEFDVDSMRMATGANTSGTLNFSAGTMNVNDSLFVGNSGTAVVNMTGGVLNAADVYIGGGGATGVGTFNISSGTFTPGGNFYIGYNGNGTLNVTGGMVSTWGLYAGGFYSAPQGNAVINLSSGTLQSNWYFEIGFVTTGTMNMSGGEFDDLGGLGFDLAYSAGSKGTLNFSGGVMNVAAINGGSGTATVNFTTTGTATFTTNLSGAMNVNQTGTGTTVFTGTGNFTGTTTVSAGRLTVNGSLTPDTIVNGGMLNGSGTTGNVVVNNGGTLGGSLKSGTVTVNTGGTVSPGNSPGANSATSITFNASATFKAEIAAPTSGGWTGAHPVAGVDYDQLTLTGANDGTAETVLALDSTADTGSILRLNVTGALPANSGGPYDPNGTNTSLDNYFILKLSDSADVISGRFARVTLDGITYADIDYSVTNLFAGANGIGVFTLDGITWAISYQGDSDTNATLGGNDVVISEVIPEPSTYALLAIGLAAIAASKRRKPAYRPTTSVF